MQQRGTLLLSDAVTAGGTGVKARRTQSEGIGTGTSATGEQVGEIKQAWQRGDLSGVDWLIIHHHQA